MWETPEGARKPQYFQNGAGGGGGGEACAVPRFFEGKGWDGGWVGWLVGWLLPLCPSARPGPPRLQATGGRGCVTRCTSHVPRALGLARAALARSRSVPSPVSGTSGSTA